MSIEADDLKSRSARAERFGMEGGLLEAVDR